MTRTPTPTYNTLTKSMELSEVDTEVCKFQKVLNSLTVGVCNGDEWWEDPEYNLS